MNRLIVSVTTLIALAVGATTAAAQETQNPKVIGLLFYADWCGSCKVLEPKLDAVKTEFAGKPVLFTRVDLTDDFTKQQSALFAQWVGLKDLYAEQAGKTGFMLLIDAKEKKVLGRLTRDQSEEQLKADIQKALGG
jgi:thiol-disulfide isomerase/thioredoxin